MMRVYEYDKITDDNTYIVCIYIYVCFYLHRDIHTICEVVTPLPLRVTQQDWNQLLHVEKWIPKNPHIRWSQRLNNILNWVVATQTFFIFTPSWGNDPI